MNADCGHSLAPLHAKSRTAARSQGAVGLWLLVLLQLFPPFALAEPAPNPQAIATGPALSPPTPQTDWTLTALQLELLKTSPEGRARQARLQLAERKAQEPRLFSDPTISLQHQQVPGTSSQAASEQTLEVSLPLPINGKRMQQKHLAQQALQVAKAEEQQTLAEHLSALSQAYFELLYLTEASQLLAARLEALAELERIAQKREALGQLSGLDRLRLLNQGAVMRGEVARLQGATARAQGKLQALLGFAQPLRLTGTLRTPLALPSLETLLAHAQSEGALRPVQARVLLAEQQRTAARRSLLPDPVVSAGLWHVSDATQSALGFTAGLSIPLPVSGHAQARIAVADAEAQAVIAEAESVSIRVRADLSAAHLAMEAARLRADAFEGTEVNNAARALKLATLAYHAGTLDLTTWMETLHTAEALEAQTLEAFWQARMAEVDVQTLAGYWPVAEQARPEQKGATP